MKNNELSDRDSAVAVPESGSVVPNGTSLRSNRVEQDFHAIIEKVTYEYLDRIDPNKPVDLESVRCGLYSETKTALLQANAIKSRDDRKFPISNTLETWQVAAVAVRLMRVVRINTTDATVSAFTDGISSVGDRNVQPLGFYVNKGDNEGIYDTKYGDLQALLMELIHLTPKTWPEVEMYLRSMAPEAFVNRNPNLVAVKNGIYDMERHALLPFTPDIVFLSKTGVDYVDNPVNPVITNTEKNYTWDVESWMHEIADDPEVERLLWEIGHASLCPSRAWNKMVCFYSEVGNNGKGTFCTMIRNLVPHGSISISIEQFSKEYYLDGLLGAQVIVTDENPVGVFLSDMSNFKAAITHDELRINMKYKAPCSVRWQGFMIQCINDLPKLKDRTDSLYRRLLFVPFNKSFTGCEKPEIKHEYLAREDVLEYVQWKILNMDVEELSNPKACRDLMDTYKEYNDSTREFWNEFKDQFVWDLLPWTFLYDLYKAWFKLTYPSGMVSSRNVFIKDMRNTLWKDPVWAHSDNSVVKTGSLMNKPEYLIHKYNLTDWMDSSYKGSDIDRICRSKKAAAYRGVKRV